jgi:chitin disaccharide deacetylase
VPGLLIINADDFGGNRLATDRIAECFAADRVTSTSAMVYMGDSERAAGIARSRQLSVGLHLNITQEFDDPATPRLVRERQARVARYFAGRRLRRFTFNPVLNAWVRRCLTDQLERFRELFGREPSHIDGHNHAHLSPTVLLALPKGMPIRTAQSRGPDHPGALTQRARHALIARRQTTTDYFLAINRLGPEPTDEDIEGMLGLADHASLEVMVHPDRDYDHRLLMSEAWMRALRRRTLGSFEQL